MKHLFFILALLSSTTFIKSHSMTIDKGTISYYNCFKEQQLTVAEVFYNKLEVSNRLPIFMGKFLDKKALERPEVPSSIWTLIKNNIDYTEYKNAVITILNNNLSQTAMQNLIDIHENSSYIPIPNVELKRELYIALGNFNPIFINQVNNILINNSYTPISL